LHVVSPAVIEEKDCLRTLANEADALGMLQRSQSASIRQRFLLPPRDKVGIQSSVTVILTLDVERERMRLCARLELSTILFVELDRGHRRSDPSEAHHPIAVTRADFDETFARDKVRNL
jgi:hypothetical protein